MELHTAMEVLRWVAAAILVGFVARAFVPLVHNDRRKRDADLEAEDIRQYFDRLEREGNGTRK